MITRLMAGSLVLVAMLGACRTAAPPPDATGLPSSLGEPPSSRIPRTATGNAAAPADPTVDASAEPTSGNGGGTGSNGGGSGNGGGIVRGPFRTIGSITDARGDQGAIAPAYTDIVRVELRDDGVDARAIVTLDAAVPNPVPGDEQMAIGVDLYRKPGGESDYQVLAIGTDDGWLAYLTTPKGVVDYPGAFAIQGRTLVFQVPWSRLGDLRGKGFSAFLDWDREQPVINRVAQDRAPRNGTESFAR
jgi:hypothetical protein